MNVLETIIDRWRVLQRHKQFEGNMVLKISTCFCSDLTFDFSQSSTEQGQVRTALELKTVVTLSAEYGRLVACINRLLQNHGVIIRKQHHDKNRYS